VGLESIYRKLPNGEIAKITESDVMISGDEGSIPEIYFDLDRGGKKGWIRYFSVRMESFPGHNL